ncbi:MAG: hypothetical protein IPJ71_06905 [Bdellovibrionales bacterium]|nr:hypothetical protein [Bdellovibrionales bacterium]
MPAFCKAPLFSKNLEYLNLAIPFIWYPLIALDLFIFPGALGLPTGSQQNTLWDFVRNIIFLNSIHALFPYIFLFRSEEIKNWILLQGGGKFGFWSKLVGVQSFFFLFFFKIQIISHWATNSLAVEFIVAVVTIGLFSHHPLAQIRGISRLYDIRNEPTDPVGTVNLRKSQKREKYLFILYTWAFVLLMVVLFSNLIGPNRFFWLHYAFLFLLPFCLGIILNFFSYPKPWNYLKLLYLLRSFAFPLIFLSPAAKMVIGTSHGIESFCVYRHVKERSKSGKQWMNITAYSLFSFVLLGLLFNYRNLSFLNWLRIESEFTSRAITSLGLSFIFTHYYIEAILYRFRKPDCREHTLPLLVNPPTNLVNAPAHS